MTFKLSTKPLSDALTLGIVNSNISKFNAKSCIAQLTADATTFKINLEPSRVVTEIRLRGIGEGFSGAETRFVDSLVFKQLVSTFDTNTVEIDFVEGGIVLHSGKSKFTLPDIAGSGISSMSLRTPVLAEYATADDKIKKAEWTFIKNRQQKYASVAFIKAVYTRYYVNASGDVIIGDFDNNIFSHSTKSTLGETCLLSDTVLNLICSLPDGATIKKIEDGYQVRATTDAFEMVSDFYPEYEDEAGVGVYHDELIMPLFDHPADYIKLSTKDICKAIKQAELLSPSSDADIIFGVEDGHAFLKDSKVDVKFSIEGNKDSSYKLSFSLKNFSEVINNYPDDTVYVGLTYLDGEVSGILTWDDNMEIVLACRE